MRKMVIRVDPRLVLLAEVNGASLLEEFNIALKDKVGDLFHGFELSREECAELVEVVEE